MSIKLALLKSGEEVIADIAEFRNSEDELVSYLFKDPYCVKIKTSQVLVEEETRPKHEIAQYKWMTLSKDDVYVDADEMQLDLLGNDPILSTEYIMKAIYQGS